MLEDDHHIHIRKSSLKYDLESFASVRINMSSTDLVLKHFMVCDWETMAQMRQKLSERNLSTFSSVFIL